MIQPALTGKVKLLSQIFLRVGLCGIHFTKWEWRIKPKYHISEFSLQGPRVLTCLRPTGAWVLPPPPRTLSVELDQQPRPCRTSSGRPSPQPTPDVLRRRYDIYAAKIVVKESKNLAFVGWVRNFINSKRNDRPGEFEYTEDWSSCG